MKKWLACLLLVAASGCPDVTADLGEGPGEVVPGPTVEFDPTAGIIPFPNNLLIDPTTGKVNIPPQACESPTAKALRENVLNKLDGFGTYEAAEQVTFTEPVDPATLPGHIVMYQRTSSGTALDPTTATPIPVALVPSTTLRFDAADCASPAQVAAVTIIPLVPLQERSTYTVAVLAGIKTATGQDYQPSFTWALVRQPVDPVTLDDAGNVVSERTPLEPGGDANDNGIPDTVELQGLDLLWKAHARALAFLDMTPNAPSRDDVLLAWEVTTQTTTDPLDPTVTNSPASMLATSPLVGTNSLTCDIDTAPAGTCPNGYHRAAPPYDQCPTTGASPDDNTQCFMKIALGVAACGGQCTTPAEIYATGDQVCGRVGCAAIGDVLGAGLVTNSYQTPRPNPLPGGQPVPGPWDDPVHPSVQGPDLLKVLIFVPSTAVTAGPYSTLVFSHGLGSSKESLFALAPQLAASPAHFASVAIDFVAHGSRAVQISNDAALGCSGTPIPTQAPQCFAPIFSADLATTRDNIRQSVLDLERLVNALKACGTAGCASANNATSLEVDPAHIVYGGISLGGIIGTTMTAMTPDLQAGFLNVPGIGLLDILENTETLEISCSLVDALIDAGVLMGEHWNGSTTAPTGLCATPAWKTQPGYQQFAVTARWVLDPADDANYVARLAPKKFLIQEVVGDQVVPNLATDNEGKLLGLTPLSADPYVPPNNTAPSAAITTDPLASKWVRYADLPPDPNTGFPGNAFWHGSLLRPAPSVPPEAGLLGTARVQTDGIAFLVFNH